MIKRTWLVAAFILTLALPRLAAAQEERRFEAFGNFSYLFADVGGSGFNNDVSGPGFNAGATFFINDWLGVGGELGYQRGDLDLPVIAIFPLPEVTFSQWTALFGPRFRLVRSDRFRLGAEAMAGIAHGSADISFDPGILAGNPGYGLGLRAFDVGFGDTVFALLFGVHFDARLNDRVVWRVVQPDLLITGYGNDAQTHFRISSGLAFDF
ncbi:MAG: outer membrane beta-barrel protein [Acidobacteriota bacterium]|jgi:hypothetical protein